MALHVILEFLRKSSFNLNFFIQRKGKTSVQFNIFPKTFFINVEHRAIKYESQKIIINFHNQLGYEYKTRYYNFMNGIKNDLWHLARYKINFENSNV